MNILFSCAGRRTYLLKYFKDALDGNGLIIATDMQATAPALSAADIVEIVPSVYTEGYIEKLLDICNKHNVKAIISLNDLELPILANSIDRFNAIGVHPIVSSSEIIDICFDKYKTAQYLERLGLNTPMTFTSYNAAIKALKTGELKFPLVLKPRWGSGSIGIEIVEDIEELELAYKLLYKKIKRTILSKASIGDDYLLFQEKISGNEYGLDIMNDLDGNNVAVSVKRKLAMRAGETDKAITIDNEEIRRIGIRIANSLKHTGNLDCDILEQCGQYYVLELNPRFGGGYPFSHEAGVNMPKAIIKWLQGETVSPDMLTPSYGKTFAKCDYLVEIS